MTCGGFPVIAIGTSVELLLERVGVVEISICRTVVEAVNPDDRNGIWKRCHGCAVVENDGVREGL